METRPLEPIFTPRSVAIVGASGREGSVGRALLYNTLINGYTGVVYPINARAKSVLGVKSYPSVLDVPDDVDLAVLVVPAVTVPAILAECGQKKVKGIVVISAGFKEMGAQGASLERSLRSKARKWGMSLVGPNCLGVMNTSPSTRLNATFGRTMARPGNIAFISQSGAVGAAALEYAEQKHIGLSKFASIGNKADVNENDLLAYLKDDPETDVICLYLEDMVDPSTFMQLARSITSHSERPKPILAIKSGRTVEGARAASSHTGALAGSDEVFSAFFAQSRIIRVENLHDIFDQAVALSNQPLPAGSRVAIITNAGGMGIMATDACISNGLKLAKISDATKEAMSKSLPATASMANPIDIIGDADQNRYAVALDAVLSDQGVDGVIAAWTPTFMAETRDVAAAIAATASKYEKPVLACMQTMGGDDDVRDALGEARIPLYHFPEEAARSMAAMARVQSIAQSPFGEIVKFDDADRGKVKNIFERAMGRPKHFLSEPEGHEILSAYGLPVLPHVLAKSMDEAVAAAERIGYPVVLKIVSPDILHKTEFGGVKVNLKNRTELEAAWTGMMAAVDEKKPGADVWGGLVMKMAMKGTEVILGMNRDPQFGHIIMFGLGGILVEALKDVSFRVAPVNNSSAENMIRETKAFRLLQGFRGMPARDISKLQDCILRLSQLVCDFPMLEEIDINPLLVHEEGQGASVIDARMLLAP